MNLLQPDRLDRLAREYALGTLIGGARRRFERVLRQSPAAALAVGVWQERLAALAAAVPPVTPTERVWQGLERRLFASRPAPAARRGWLGALLSGRSLGGALAGVVLAVLVLRQQPALIGAEPRYDGLPASYIGLLHDAQDRPAVLASSLRQGRLLTVKLLRPLDIPAGQVAQLWAVPADGTPFPVGVLPAQGSARLALPDSAEKLFFHVPRLALSFEPRAAAPGERPSGEFVLTGSCVKLW